MAHPSSPSPSHSPPLLNSQLQTVSNELVRILSVTSSTSLSSHSYLRLSSSFLPHTLSLFLLYLFFFSPSLHWLFFPFFSCLLLHTLSSSFDFVLIFSIHPATPTTTLFSANLLWAVVLILLSLSSLNIPLCIPQLAVPGGRLPTESRFSERDFWQCLVCSALVDAVCFAALVFVLFCHRLIRMRPLGCFGLTPCCSLQKLNIRRR